MDVKVRIDGLPDLLERAKVTQVDIAATLGFRNRASVCHRLAGRRRWYYDELIKLAALLRAKGVKVKVDTLVRLAGPGRVVVRQRVLE